MSAVRRWVRLCLAGALLTPGVLLVLSGFFGCGIILVHSFREDQIPSVWPKPEDAWLWGLASLAAVVSGVALLFKGASILQRIGNRRS